MKCPVFIAMIFAVTSSSALAAGPIFDPESPPVGTSPPTEAYNEYSGSFAHQKGPKSVFVFLIEPSDGAVWANPPSQATLEGQLNNTSQNYYNASYRQTWFGPKYRNPDTPNEVLVPRLVVSPVVRLSKTAAALMNAISTQAFDAKTLVEALGGEWTNDGPEDPDHYDRWVVMSNTKLISSTGLAYVGGRISWTGGSLSGTVAEHELGHNWGVFHANAWTVSEGSAPRSSAGSSAEYKDGWDIMGGGDMGTAFNPLFREKLGFLQRSRGEVLDVTTPGSYRLYDYIDPYSRNATSRIRSLLLPMSSFTDAKRVFLGFGHVSGTDGGSSRSDWNRNAITVHSGLSDGSNRIDTTPFSRQSDDENDSSIKIGRTYTETPNVNGTQIYGGFSVTPMLRGSIAVAGNTHEWMDVFVHYGPPSVNPPVASFAQTTFATAPGSAVGLAVNAMDPDGGILAFDWDFGDGSYSISNSAEQTKSWSSPGIYLVTCTVSDMTGNTATANCWVNVGSVPSRPSDQASSTLPGLAYRYFEGSFTTLPVFSNLLPVTSGTSALPDLSGRQSNDQFAFLYEGFIDVPDTDIHTFRLSSDDGSRLWIGDTLLIDNNGLQSKTFSKSGNIALDAGLHRIRIEFFHKDGAETLALAWSTRTSPMAPVPATAFHQVESGSNAAPVVAITQPLAGASFVVGSDVLVQADATDADGISSVAFFSDGSFLGSDNTAPFTYSWPKVSVGLRSLVAVAYDQTGRWTRSATVEIDVVSPPPQPSIGLNLNPMPLGKES